MSASQSIVERRRCHAYWVDANPLCRYPLPTPKRRTSSTLRPHAAALSRNSKVSGKSSRRLWLPYRVSPMHHRDRDLLFAQRMPRSPLPRFVPLQRLASLAEPHTPDGSQTTGYVAPSGFLTLSTLCSPRDLLGLFHPSSALGVYPSRPYSLLGAVRPLGRRIPLEVRSIRLAERPLQGVARQAEPGPRAWGLARIPCRCPLGLFPLQGFLSSTAARRFRDALSPLALSRLGRTLTSPLVPQGLLRRRRSRSLSRSTQPP